jgi:hypothetical protein
MAADSEEAASTNIIEYPVNNVIAGGSAADQATLRDSTLLEQILRPESGSVGGNAYFLKTVAESIFDRGDHNKPVFSSGSYWAYSVMIAGAGDASSILDAARFFQGLIGGSGDANQVSPGRGLSDLVPRGVRATPSGQGGFAVVSWDLVPVTSILRSYDQSQVVADKYAIIRSTGLDAKTATHVTDLFSTRELTEGLNGRSGAKVLAVKEYDGVVTRYLDESPVERGVTYYYHVAFSTKVNPSLAPINAATPDDADLPGGGEAQTEEVGFNLLSSAVTFQKPVTRAGYGGAGTGQAPDWMRTPSVAAMVPSLERLIDKIQEYLRKFGNTVNNVSTQNDQFIRYLNNAVSRLAREAADLQGKISGINSAFGAPASGVYGTFRYGSGGVSSVLADMTRAFEDNADPNQPPFLDDQSYVTGVVILATGPDPAPILAFWNLLQLLLAPVSNTDPALLGIQSINTQLATVEADLVSQITGGTNNPLNPSVTFNEDMTPRGAGEGDSTCDP